MTDYIQTIIAYAGIILFGIAITLTIIGAFYSLTDAKAMAYRDYHLSKYGYLLRRKDRE